MTRQDPATAGAAKRGTDCNPLESLGQDWEKLAQAHCAGRNKTVNTIIAYCLLIRHRQPHLGGHFTAANWQLPREVETAYVVPPEWEQKIADAALDTEKTTRLKNKFILIENAHRMPCEIQLSGLPLERYLAASGNPDSVLHAENVRFLFGAVDRLPKIFNEADSQAEGAARTETLNLKGALLAACMTLSSQPPQTGRGALQQALHVAFATWLAEADLAFVRAIEQNRQWYDEAPAKSYDRLYRELKLIVLEHYRRFTQSETQEVRELSRLPIAEEFA